MERRRQCLCKNIVSVQLFALHTIACLVLILMYAVRFGNECDLRVGSFESPQALFEWTEAVETADSDARLLVTLNVLGLLGWIVSILVLEHDRRRWMLPWVCMSACMGWGTLALLLYRRFSETLFCVCVPDLVAFETLRDLFMLPPLFVALEPWCWCCSCQGRRRGRVVPISSTSSHSNPLFSSHSLSTELSPASRAIVLTPTEMDQRDNSILHSLSSPSSSIVVVPSLLLPSSQPHLI